MVMDASAAAAPAAVPVALAGPVVDGVSALDCSPQGLAAFSSGAAISIVDLASMQLVHTLVAPPPPLDRSGGLAGGAAETAGVVVPVTAARFKPGGLDRDLAHLSSLQLAAGDRAGRVALWEVVREEVDRWLLPDRAGGTAGGAGGAGGSAGGGAAGSVDAVEWVMGRPWLLAVLHASCAAVVWDLSSSSAASSSPAAAATATPRVIWRYDGSASPTGELLVSLALDPHDPRRLCVHGARGLVLALQVDLGAQGKGGAGGSGGSGGNGGGAGKERGVSIKTTTLQLPLPEPAGGGGGGGGGGPMGAGASVVACAFAPHTRDLLYAVLPRDIVCFDLHFGCAVASSSVPRSVARLTRLLLPPSSDVLYCLHADGKLSMWQRRPYAWGGQGGGGRVGDHGEMGMGEWAWGNGHGRMGAWGNGHGGMGMGEWAWGNGHGGMGMGEWAWGNGHGGMGMGEWAWGNGHGGMGMGEWAWGNGHGGMGGMGEWAWGNGHRWAWGNGHGGMGMGEWAWGNGHGGMGMGEWAWGNGHGGMGMGEWAWGNGHGGMGMGEWAWGNGHGGMGMGEWAWGNGHGGMGMGEWAWGNGHGGMGMGEWAWGNGHGGMGMGEWAWGKGRQLYMIRTVEPLVPLPGSVAPSPGILAAVLWPQPFREAQLVLQAVPATTPRPNGSLGGGVAAGVSLHGVSSCQVVCVSDDNKLWHWLASTAPVPGGKGAVGGAGDGEKGDGGDGGARGGRGSGGLELLGMFHGFSSAPTTLSVPAPSLFSCVPGLSTATGSLAAAAVPLVAVATQEGGVELVDTAVHAIAASFLLHPSMVRGVRWLGNTRLVSFSFSEAKAGGYENRVVVTCIRSGESRPFRQLQQPDKSPMRGLRASPSGRYLLILFRDAPAEVWAMTRTPQMLRSLALPFTVMEWALPPVQSPTSLDPHSATQRHMHDDDFPASPTSAALLAATPRSASDPIESFAFALVNGSLGVFELRGKRVRDFRPKWPSASFVAVDVLVTAMAYRTPVVALGDKAGVLRWWDVASGAAGTHALNRGAIRRLRFAPTLVNSSSCGRIAVMFNDYTFALFDLDEGEFVPGAMPSEAAASLQVLEMDWLPLQGPSPTGPSAARQLLCVAAADGTVRLLDMAT
ncbi:unnamed protein product [Closterium sp. Naga37s-1]|nr:unnamed protein product [Closterium sp. Naga37s-1]